MVSGGATLFDLGLPDRAEFDRVMNELSPEARVRFYEEIVSSLYEIQDSGSVESLSNTARAWYRSAAFLAKPGFSERLSEASDVAKRLIGQ